VTRRGFLKQGALAAGAAAVVGLARGPILLGAESPNEKLGMVVIGCGGRGMSSHMPVAGRERLLAIVDVDENQWGKSMKFLEDKFKDIEIPKVKTYFDYRRMFDEIGKEIDAVLVATPNHHHALPAMIAMQLGKGVYVEKPLCHTVAEARALAATAARTKVPTQMGNQGHCGEGYMRLCEYIWAGAIGQVTEVHSWSDRANGGSKPRPAAKPVPQGMHWDEWIGPSPYRDFHDDLHPHEWHNWWDFGNGSIGNMACHVMDGACWALKLGHPVSIEAELLGGGTEEYAPTTTRLCYAFPAREGLAPVKLYWYDGKRPGSKGAAEIRGKVLPVDTTDGQNRPPLVYQLEKETGRKLGGNGTLYVGEKGVMYTGCYGEGTRILPEEKHQAFPPPEKTLPRVSGGSFGDFVAACRKGTPTTAASFEYGSRLTELVLLGNLAQRVGVGKKVMWDGPGAKCTNIPGVNAWIDIKPRKGWTA
jgi:predicted dehydrogenase